MKIKKLKKYLFTLAIAFIGAFAINNNKVNAIDDSYNGFDYCGDYDNCKYTDNLGVVAGVGKYDDNGNIVSSNVLNSDRSLDYNYTSSKSGVNYNLNYGYNSVDNYFYFDGDITGTGTIKLNMPFSYIVVGNNLQYIVGSNNITGSCTTWTSGTDWALGFSLEGLGTFNVPCGAVSIANSFGSPEYFLSNEIVLNFRVGNTSGSNSGVLHFDNYRLYSFMVVENSSILPNYFSLPGEVLFYNSSFIENNNSYSQGYDTGYSFGYNTGYDEGQIVGYNTGYDEGNLRGYANGYSAGINYASLEENTLIGMIGAIFTGPVTMLTSIFDFEFLGINLVNLVLSLLTLLVVIWLIKKFI